MDVVEFFRKWTSSSASSETKFVFDERLAVQEIPSQGMGVIALQDIATDARPLIVVPKFQQLRVENSDISKLIDGIPGLAELNFSLTAHSACRQVRRVGSDDFARTGAGHQLALARLPRVRFLSRCFCS